MDEHINVFLTSRTGAAVQVTDAVSGAILYTGSVTSASGKFFADFPGTSASIKVTVTDPLGSFGPASATANVIDYVNITSCTYSLGTGLLTVAATSSDLFTAAKKGRLAPTLTVTGFGTLSVDTFGTYTYSAPLAVGVVLPPTLTVTSTTGGSDTASVGIIP